MAELATCGTWTLHKVKGRITARGSGKTDMDAAMYGYIEVGGAAFDSVFVDSSMERFSEPGNEGTFYFATMKVKKKLVTVFLAYSGDRGEGSCRLAELAGKMARPPMWTGIMCTLGGILFAVFIIGLFLIPAGIYMFSVSAKIKRGASGIDHVIQQDFERERTASLQGTSGAASRPAPATA